MSKLKHDAENTLKERGRFFQEVFEQGPIPMGLATSDTQLVAANQALANLLGFSREELLRMSLAQFTHPDDRAKTLEQFHKLFRNELPGYQMENRYVSKSGASIWVRVTCAAMRGANGNTLYNLGIFQDISQRKRAEQRLAAQYAVSRVLASWNNLADLSAPLLEAICKSLGWDIGVLWKLDFNEKNLFCLNLWRIAGSNLDDFEAATRRTVFPKAIGLPGRVWATGRPAWITDVVQDVNFPRAPFAARSGLHTALGFPIALDGKFFGVIEFFSRQIQPPDPELAQMFAAAGNQIGQFLERQRAAQALARRTEELARSNAELEMFATIASHDLQEPLRRIISFADLIRTKNGTALDAQGLSFLEKIENAASRMARQLEELLQYSKVAGYSRPFERVELGPLVAKVLSELRARIIESNAEVVIGDLPAVDADPEQMRELLCNLLTNALKFRNLEKRPRIHVKGWALDAKFVEFIVQDNGIGFDEKYLDRIFKPFQRLNSREYSGAGMGLAICQKIVLRHGGTIAAKSVPGQGSTFVVTLPFHHPKAVA